MDATTFRMKLAAQLDQLTELLRESPNFAKLDGESHAYKAIVAGLKDGRPGPMARVAAAIADEEIERAVLCKAIITMSGSYEYELNDLRPGLPSPVTDEDRADDGDNADNDPFSPSADDDEHTAKIKQLINALTARIDQQAEDWRRFIEGDENAGGDGAGS